MGTGNVWCEGAVLCQGCLCFCADCSIPAEDNASLAGLAPPIARYATQGSTA